MPVKLTSDGKPLAESVKQAPTQQATAASANAVDALLDNAANVPAVTQAEQAVQQVVVTAEAGTISKEGAITVETTEHMHVWLNAPHPNYTGPFGKVTYGMAATINTGNYENIRPFVQIEVPFIPGQQDAAYAYAEEWADARITSIIGATKAGISGA